jgi:hypothetical protein
MLNHFIEGLSVNLSKKNEEMVTADVIKVLNTPEVNPLERSARVKFLSNALAAALPELTQAARRFAIDELHKPVDVQFTYEGQKYLISRTWEYNYADNDDVPEHEGEYRKACLNVKVADQALKAAKQELKNAEELIELAHPKMKPMEIKDTFKWQGQL